MVASFLGACTPCVPFDALGRRCDSIDRYVRHSAEKVLGACEPLQFFVFGFENADNVVRFGGLHQALLQGVVL